MAKKKQSQKQAESSNSESQNNPSQQEDISNDDGQMDQQQEIPDNMDIPFQEYRKSFSVFKNHKIKQLLKTYINVKAQSQFNKLKNAFASILCEQNQPISQQVEKGKENSSTSIFQHFMSCKVPPNTTIFIHISQVDKNRCNIKATNASGYVLAYLSDIRLSRKFYKIYKLIKKVGNKSLFIIYDEFQLIAKEASFVKKLSDYAKNICYYCKIEGNNIPSKFLSFDLLEEQIIDVRKNLKQDPTFVLIQESVFWFFSQIFTKNQEDFIILLKKMREVQSQVENPTEISSIKTAKDSPMDFVIKCILTNYSKSRKFQSEEQILDSFKQIIQPSQNTFKNKNKIELGNPDYHFPEQMKACKECSHCHQKRIKLVQASIDQMQIENKQKSKKSKEKPESNKKSTSKSQSKDIEATNTQGIISLKKAKTKYRCQGCSATAKKDIPLCLQCFEQYHQKKQLIKKKYIKKMAKVNELKNQRKIEKLQEDKKKQSILPINEGFLENKIKNKLSQRENHERNTCLHQVQNQQKKNKFEQLEKSNALHFSPEQEKTQNNQNSLFVHFQNCLNSQSDNQDSRYSINTSRRLTQLRQNEQYSKILEKIQAEKIKFMENFSSLLKKDQTRNFAITTAEYLKLKAVSLLETEKK